MASRRAGRVGASVFVLLAFAGTWLGHTIEYLRVDGPAGVVRDMTGPVHLYMLPVGAALVALAVVNGMVWLRTLTLLAERLERLRGALRRARPLADAYEHGAVSVPGRAARAGSLWLALSLTQVGLYLLQENVESHLAHLRAPGLGAALGQHWAAVPIQMLVAAGLAVMASGLVRHRRRLERAVARHERLHARLWGRRIPLAPTASGEPRVLTPHERWSSQRWQRPPPASIAA